MGRRRKRTGRCDSETDWDSSQDRLSWLASGENCVLLSGAVCPSVGRSVSGGVPVSASEGELHGNNRST